MAYRVPFRTPLGAFQRSPLRARTRAQGGVDPGPAQLLPGFMRLVDIPDNVPDPRGELSWCYVTYPGSTDPVQLAYRPDSCPGALSILGGGAPLYVQRGSSGVYEHLNLAAQYDSLSPGPATGPPVVLDATCHSIVDSYTEGVFDDAVWSVGIGTGAGGVAGINLQTNWITGSFGPPLENELNTDGIWITPDLPLTPAIPISETISVPASQYDAFAVNKADRLLVAYARVQPGSGYPYFLGGTVTGEPARMNTYASVDPTTQQVFAEVRAGGGSGSGYFGPDPGDVSTYTWSVRGVSSPAENSAVLTINWT